MRRIGVTVFATMLLAACAHSHVDPTASGPSPVPRPTVTITIDASDGVTLAPAPASARPGLTAQEALDRFLVHVEATPRPIPSEERVLLGLLTIPQGGPSPYPGEEYTAKNQLVWAFGHSVDDCPSSGWVPGPGQTPPSSVARPGVEWEFLDANTGEQIEGTCQLLIPPTTTAE